MKTLPLLLLLCATASAQTDYTYTSPELTGSLVLSAPLAANLNNQTVVPLSFVFGPLDSQFLQAYPAGSYAQFAFSTDSAGVIDGWNVSVKAFSGYGSNSSFTQWATSTPGGDTYLGVKAGPDCQWAGTGASLCPPVLLTGMAGTWVDPPAGAVAIAPEIEPTGALGAFLLLAGGLAVIRGRSRGQS
jgi:hypothetical protein